MSKFKGYAQSSGFKNIQLPDQTKRIREKGQRTISRMETNFQIQLDNSRAVIDALNERYRIEEQNRDMVFDLETENRNQIRDRMVENNRVANENLRRERKKSEEIFTALADFSTTAKQVAAGELKRREEVGKQQGVELANTLALAGGNYADVLAVKELDAAHAANNEAHQDLVDRLRANGAPNNIIEQIRNANGSKLYNLKKTLLVEAGNRWPEELVRLETQMLIGADGNDTQYTLGQARTMGGQYEQLVEAQELRNRADYINQYKGNDDDPMVARYLYPKMVEAERANARGRAAEERQASIREDELSARQEIRTAYNDNGHQSVFARIANSKYKLTERTRTWEVYSDLIASGAWGNTIKEMSSEFDALMDTEIRIGDGPPQKVRDLYGRYGTNDEGLADLRDAIYARHQVVTGRSAELEAAEKQKRADVILQKFLATYEEGVYTNEFIQEIIADMKAKGLPTDEFQAATKFSTYEVTERKRTIAEFEEKRANGTLTLRDFVDEKDKVVLEHFKEFILAQQAFIGQMPIPNRDDVEKGFKEALAKKLGAQIDPTSGRVEDEDFHFKMTLSEIMRKYDEGINVDFSTTNAADVQNNVINKLMEQIADNSDGSPYEVIAFDPERETDEDVIPIDGPYFARFKAASDNTKYEGPDIGYNIVDVLEFMKRDPNLPLKKAIISSDMAEVLAGQIKEGNPIVLPTIIHQLAEASGLPAHQILTAQLKKSGYKDLKATPDLIEKITDIELTPELRLLISKPTSTNINNVVIGSGNQVPFVRRGDDGFVDVLSLGRSLKFQAPAVMASVWALETGNGTTVHGRNTLFNVKSYDGTGTTTTTEEYDADGNPYNTQVTWRNYDTPAQSAQDFINTISKYPGVNEATTPREMALAIAAGGYGTDPNYAGKLIDVMIGYGVNVDGPFDLYDGPVTRDPSYMSPTVLRTDRQAQANVIFSRLAAYQPQVSSVTFDTGQPGIDVFFEDKKFPAVLNGTVKDIRTQINSDGSGYGHFVVVESIDPTTGQKVDVLYGHLSEPSKLKIGQQINAGDLIGQQGGTGSVQSYDGTIASIDFLAPAPQGSNSMTPYSNYDRLRRRIARSLQG